MSDLYTVFIKLFKSYAPLDYYAFYEAEMVRWDNANQKADVKPKDPRLPTDGMTDVPFRSGIPGVQVNFSSPSGVKCIIGFEGGNRSLPYIASWLGCVPSEVTVTAAKVVVDADSVFLADGSATSPVPFGDITKRLVAGTVDLLKTMVPQGVCLGIPVPVAFATDVAGANGYGAGGIIAVSTAMTSDFAQMNSSKVKTS